MGVYRKGDLLEYDSPDCGYAPMERTISGTPYCSGYDKMVDVYDQVSYDSGQTWQTTATTTTLVEADSEDCGYVPSTLVLTAKFDVTYTYGPTRIASATTSFSSIEIDGVEQQSVTTGYTFSTKGEHTVKYYLTGTTIGTQAFYTCYSITDIDIPSGVTSIGWSAFDNCRSLTSIDIPDSVTEIGRSAFYDCRSLPSIVIPDSVTSIDEGAFRACNSLTSCTLSNSITSLSKDIFYECGNLTNIDIPSGVTSIGNYAFQNCRGLTSCTINAVTPPTASSNIFRNTPIESGTGYIYVTSASVSAYQSAWSTYTNQIRPIT